MGEYLYVRVQFKKCKDSDYEGFAYLFKYDMKRPAIRENDLVICETRYGIALGKVKDINLECPDKKFKEAALKSIITVVDLSDYYRQKEREEKISALKEEMRKRIEEVKEIEMARMMSEKDDSLKALLEEYDSLTKGE